MKTIFKMLLLTLIACQHRAYIQAPATAGGDTIRVKKIIIERRIWNRKRHHAQVIGSFALKCNYIINLGAGKYLINGRTYELAGYDSTNVKMFIPHLNDEDNRK